MVVVVFVVVFAVVRWLWLSDVGCYCCRWTLVVVVGRCCRRTLLLLLLLLLYVGVCCCALIVVARCYCRCLAF